MRSLLLCALLLTGCGRGSILPDPEPTPGMLWSPVPGIVFSAIADHPGVYEVAMDCRVSLEFPQITFSDLSAPCSASDYEGKAYFLVTRQQLIDLGVWLQENLK